MNTKLFSNHYGKSDVRLTKIIRDQQQHRVLEFSVDIQLRGNFDDSYLHGDNTKVVATDSMKNTVYVLARENAFETPEEFAILLARHFPVTYEQVRLAQVTVRQTHWNRIAVAGRPHDHAFVCGGPDLFTASVIASRKSTRLSAGITNLLVMKTTRSAFKDFVTDRYRTLPDADDRIFATSVTAEWDFPFNNLQVDFAAVRQRVQAAMLKVFAENMSYAVQQTMHQMADAALAAAPEIKRVSLRLPNKHRIPVNLKPFGLTNENDIFVWTDEPFGDISAVVERA